MNNFEIKRGFRDVNDIDKLRVNIDIVLSWKDYISFLKKNNLKGLILYSSSDTKRTIDFSFLNEMSFLEHFECLVSLTRKSDINGLYSLSSLKSLRWIVDNKFELDFSKLTGLDVLITSDYGGMKNWNSLMYLKKFHISRLKKDDCTFLLGLNKLIELKLTRANIISIKGLEYCNRLERLELQYCNKISELISVLENCPSIRSVSLIKCKNIKMDEIERIKNSGKNLWVE